ncbi:MAG: hypothetical protein PW844_27495 [Pantoea sp.]|uniref:hypothetical protein n=1 Tax=Pantoea sp. TaxID=69393 RepID=UPI0023A680D5|nr:hypothetical protein [Pantoea sp.]MDE1190162.1 hypothetical protein [Pantoea sp.]
MIKQALLVLTRLPTEDDIENDCSGIELMSFSEGFNANLVSGLIARVNWEYDHESNSDWIELGGWQWHHNSKVDWYQLVKP